MALYDDKWWLLSHISHSFVLSDDSGNAELVMTNRDVKAMHNRVKADAEKEGTADFLEPLQRLEEPDDSSQHSFEIRLGRNQLGYHHRPRSNTELKLEKLRRDRRNVPRFKTINWRENPMPLFGEELDDLFPKQEVVAKYPPLSGTNWSKVVPPPSSLLSFQLENLVPSIPSNPFEVFAKFDGSAVSAKDRIRTLDVFLDMCEGSDREYPLKIQVVGSAKVQEVVGFICWRYTRKRRKPPLKPDIDNYALFMAESDGSIERDFPALERREPISKFGFHALGLVDVGAERTSQSPKDRRVTLVLPDGTFTLLELETRDIPLKDLVDRAMSRRKKIGSGPSYFQYNYNVEKKDAPGEALDKESLLSGYETNEFYIVRENSKRKEEAADVIGEDHRLRHQISMLEAPVYKEYQGVHISGKVWTKVEVIIGISEDKLEIYPKHSSARFWKWQKSASYNMDGLVACDIMEKKSSGRWVLRLVFQSGAAPAEQGSYKKHELECEEAGAAEIHSKINHLLNWQPNDAREEYLAYKEKKVQTRRQSWHIK